MAQLNFDATQYDTEQKDYDNLPNGIYELELEASEMKATNDGTGQRLAVTMSVLQPEEFKGRKLFEGFNLVNKNQDAVDISQRQLAALCRAIGIQKADDSEELHFKAFTAKVGMGKPSKDGQYPARNEIKKYYYPDEGNPPVASIDANQPPAAANENAQQPASANDNQSVQQQQAAAGGRPWGKK